MEFHVLQDFSAWIKGSGYLTALFQAVKSCRTWNSIARGHCILGDQRCWKLR